MSQISILVGNSEYDNLSTLSCCEADVAAINELLSATGEYDHTLTLINKTAAELKEEIRDFVDRQGEITKIFFYFTGHGLANDQGFFYCAKTFTDSEPNQTGLLDEDLDQILRTANANAVVKVIDACQSGVRAIKDSSQTFVNDKKAGFSNFFRIASCSESQSSYTGDPLSKFTTHFMDACLQKIEGKLYYTDIISFLRDVFVNDVDQVPFFVTQGDDRTMFCKDTTSLKALCEKYELSEVEEGTGDVIVADEPDPELTLVERLRLIDESYVQPDQAEEVVKKFIEQLSENIEKSNGFSEYYKLKYSSTGNYVDSSAAMRAFMIRVLEKQDRPDELVFAKHTREYKRKRRGPLGMSLAAANMFGLDDEEFADQYDLELNCSLDAASTTFTFTPKFRALKKLELNVTIAPSLPICYVFARWTTHPLKTWENFEEEGHEIWRKWYKLDWAEESLWVADAISNDFPNFVAEQVSRATKE